MSRRGWTLFVALCVVWGIPYLLIRIAVADLHPVFVAFARTLIGGLVLLPIALKQGSLRPALRRWPVLLVFTLVEISGPWVLLGTAETRLTSSTAGLLIAMVPLLAALMTRFSGTERLPRKRLVGLIIGFAGVVALVGFDIDLHEVGAVVAMFFCAIGYAAGPMIISRKLADLPAIGVITASLLMAAAIYIPALPFTWPSRIPLDAGISVLLLALVCTALAFVLFFALIAESGPSRSTVITYINPAVALLLGVLILNEPLTWGMAVGFPLVILGSVLATSRSEPRTESPVSATIGPETAAATAVGADPEPGRRQI